MTLIGPKAATLEWEWLGRIEYGSAETLQRDMAQQRAAGHCGDRLLLLEHPHVITLGRSASEDDILVPASQLAARQIQTHRCDRGGKVTYHGPGQLVGYLIVDLYERKLNVPRFVWSVEEGLRLWFQSLGVAVERRCSKPGLWYQGSKIASLGFHISRGITRHGFAINVNPELDYFDWIIPCGTQLRTTSVAEILSRTIVLPAAAASVAGALCQVLASSSGKSLVPVSSEATSPVSSTPVDSLSSS